MRIRTLLLVAIVLAAAGPRAIWGQASRLRLGQAPRLRSGQAAPWFGTWTVNAGRSTYPDPPQFKRSTCRIEPWEDGIRVTYDVVHLRGGTTHTEWTGTFDGKDYPVEGIEDYVITNAYRAIDDRTYAVVQKVEGAVTATARVAFSPDGRTMTMTTSSGRNREGQPVTTTAVYDKQQ